MDTPVIAGPRAHLAYVARDGRELDADDLDLTGKAVGEELASEVRWMEASPEVLPSLAKVGSEQEVANPHWCRRVGLFLKEASGDIAADHALDLSRDGLLRRQIPQYVSGWYEKSYSESKMKRLLGFRAG